MPPRPQGQAVFFYTALAGVGMTFDRLAGVGMNKDVVSKDKFLTWQELAEKP
jgi:hypothetical protein